MVATRLNRLRLPHRAGMRRISYIMAVVMVAAGFGCSSEVPDPPMAVVVVEDGDGDEDKIFVVDIDGKKWDVTHAVNHYGFEATKFEFGAGADAIRPLSNPEMLLPGDPGYPADNMVFTMIGTVFDGDVRAYGIDDLNFHEVVNESFGDVHVAVAW